MHIKPIVYLLVVMISLIAADVTFALQPHERDRWMVGVGLGVGTGKLTLVDPSGESRLLQTDWEEGTTPQFRFGWIFVPDRLMLSFENKQWLDEQGVPEQFSGDCPTNPDPDCVIKLRANVQHYSLGVTWFPGSITAPTGGLFIKVGAGWANARFAVLESATEEEIESSGGNEFTERFENDDHGLALFGELGYELRVWSGFAAGLSVGYNYLDLDGDFYKDAKTTAVTMSLNWYF
jgi:hypothetical protein